MTGRKLHILIVVVLVACLFSPFVEIGVHSTGNIFRTGHDRETTLALLLLMVELATALGDFLVVLLAEFVEKEPLCSLNPLSGPSDFEKSFWAPLSESESPPPIPLRI